MAGLTEETGALFFAARQGGFVFSWPRPLLADCEQRIVDYLAAVQAGRVPG